MQAGPFPPKQSNKILYLFSAIVILLTALTFVTLDLTMGAGYVAVREGWWFAFVRSYDGWLSMFSCGMVAGVGFCGLLWYRERPRGTVR